jgi:hypothetical protein
MTIYAAQIIDDKVSIVLVTQSLSWVRDNIGGEWIECDMEGSIRGCYPGIGYLYDRVNDVFVPPPPLLETP